MWVTAAAALRAALKVDAEEARRLRSVDQPTGPDPQSVADVDHAEREGAHLVVLR